MAVLGHGCLIAHFAKGLGDELVVLGTQYYCMYLHGLVGFTVVLNGELALGIRPKVRHELELVVADIGQDLKDLVAQIQRQGHVVLRVPACVAEHHALVSGALVLPVLALHAAVDVRALLMDGAQYAAAAGVKHVFGLGVAYFADCVTDGVLDVHVGFGLHFTHNHHHAGGAE